MLDKGVEIARSQKSPQAKLTAMATVNPSETIHSVHKQTRVTGTQGPRSHQPQNYVPSNSRSFKGIRTRGNCGHLQEASATSPECSQTRPTAISQTTLQTSVDPRLPENGFT